MSKIKNGGLDQYGSGPSEQQQFGTAGVEGVKVNSLVKRIHVQYVLAASETVNRHSLFTYRNH